MNKKQRKHLKGQLEELTRPQLVALATQKTELPFKDICGMSVEALVNTLIDVKSVLKPEAA